MRIISTIKILRKTLDKDRREGKSIGFVPTMGALHRGHGALLRRCRKDNDVVVLSIFVNPAQFGPQEDFSSYPRDKKNDVLLAKKENVDIIFYPSEREIYPSSFLTIVDVSQIGERLCGASRPGHFRGVATVVAKLLNIVGPHVLYLGQKDAQQCAVIQQMVRDLDIPVRVKVVPTVREPDGLALSSRNRYLSAQERREAGYLYQALTRARLEIKNGLRRTEKVVALIRDTISTQTSGKIDYIACVDARNLEPLAVVRGRVLIALAVRFGKARLIDNITVVVP